MKPVNTLAIDLGASSGKIVCGSYDGERIVLREVFRFQNVPVRRGSRLFWDAEGLWQTVMESVSKAIRLYAPVSVSFDAWGQSAVLMKNGALLCPVRHYRDFTEGDALSHIAERFSAEYLYRKTGAYPYPASTLAQLIAQPETAEADRFLFIPDYMNYLLCGVMATEPTIASTSMMLAEDGWCEEILSAFALSGKAPRLVPSGTVIGDMHPSLAHGREVKVITGAGHDSAAAYAGAPSQRSAIISSGTWSIVGAFTDHPITNALGIQNGFTSQRAHDARHRLKKSICALWLLQQCVREWNIGYDEAEYLASGEKPFPAFLDLGDPAFASFSPSMSERINDYLARAGQPKCAHIGEFVRCIYQSIARSCAEAIDVLECMTGRPFPSVCMVGGGTRSSLLCRLTAMETGRDVLLGSANAASLGNCLVQLKALGLIGEADMEKTAIRSSNPAMIRKDGSFVLQ